MEFFQELRFKKKNCNVHNLKKQNISLQKPSDCLKNNKHNINVKSALKQNTTNTATPGTAVYKNFFRQILYLLI